MYEKQIRNFKWKISDNLKIVRFDYESISEDEQECHFNIMRHGFKDDPEILVGCSYQKYITQLRKSESFLLTNLLVSTIREDKELGGFILEIQGTMPLEGITIRKKGKKKLTEKQKQELIKRIRK